MKAATVAILTLCALLVSAPAYAQGISPTPRSKEIRKYKMELAPDLLTCQELSQRVLSGSYVDVARLQSAYAITSCPDKYGMNHCLRCLMGGQQGSLWMVYDTLGNIRVKPALGCPCQ